MKKFAIIDSNSGVRYAFIRDEAVCGSDGYTVVDSITFWHLVYDDEYAADAKKFCFDSREEAEKIVDYFVENNEDDLDYGDFEIIEVDFEKDMIDWIKSGESGILH